MKTAVLAAAVLALVTVLPAALAVLPIPFPTSVQEQDAQENQCPIQNDGNEHLEGIIVDENGECQIIGNDLDIE
jgi:hypothetical protein